MERGPRVTDEKHLDHLNSISGSESDLRCGCVCRRSVTAYSSVRVHDIWIAAAGGVPPAVYQQVRLCIY